jgi:hypothetical protein
VVLIRTLRCTLHKDAISTFYNKESLTPVWFSLTVKYFGATVACHVRQEISFSRQRFRQCYTEMRVSSWHIYMRTSMTDVWMYETDEALEEYIPRGNDDTDMRLSSQNVEAATEDTEVTTSDNKVNHTCTLNFQESRVFWDRSPYLSVWCAGDNVVETLNTPSAPKRRRWKKTRTNISGQCRLHILILK